MVSERLGRKFFERDVLVVAPELLGKVLVTRNQRPDTRNGKTPGVKEIPTPGVNEMRAVISEVEAYRDEKDKASHARFGKTKRNAIMWERGGLIYMYLVYGMHWMFNIVTGRDGQPQAVLIRGMRFLLTPGDCMVQTPGVNISGPGKVTRALGLDGSHYGLDLVTSGEMWLEESRITNYESRIMQTPRIGVGYAGEWAQKPWRWVIQGI